MLILMVFVFVLAFFVCVRFDIGVTLVMVCLVCTLIAIQKL